MAAKEKFVCKNCGNETVKWAGICFACNEYGTYESVEYFTGKENTTKSSKTIIKEKKKAKNIKDIDENYIERGFSSGIGEFDRLLGGQITEGSVVLFSGDPGNGKSTLLSQVAHHISTDNPVLYVSGEESEAQMKKRVISRMKLEPNENFNLLYTNDIENIESETKVIKPKMLVIDSINTIGSQNVKGDPGDISQIKHCTKRILMMAKTLGITVFLIAQITKDKDVSGPKQLEHMVDTVAYIEGDQYSILRYIHLKKNRFGSDQVVAVFKMEEEGMMEVPNPSEFLLSNRLSNQSGTAVVCISETRPLLIEVQALASLPSYENAIPRRASEGFSRNRLNLLIAVLEKKCGVKYLSAKDLYVNIVNGLQIKETAIDLGVAMAIYSSNNDQPIKDKTVLVGEIGLVGEIRPVSKIEQIVIEAERVGFENIILPHGNYLAAKKVANKINILPVRKVKEVVKLAF